jgi:hypothetical protein
MLNACGGGSAPAAPDVSPPVVPVDPPVVPPVNPPDPPPLDPNHPLQSIMLHGMCEHPHGGTSNEQQGSHADEMNWVRAFIDDTYLWYKEVPATLKAADYATPIAFFNVLKTPAVTASGRARDRFHFTYPSDVWAAMTSAGVELSYGLTWVRSTDPKLPRNWSVTLVEPDSPAAAAGLRRGDHLLAADGALVEELGDAAVAARFNAALFPAASGETHQLLLQREGQPLTASLTASRLSIQPVQGAKVLDTPTGKVGYMLFKEHNSVAEAQLVHTISDFKAAGISDLVLDMRYNGGGLLQIASELAYMIAGPEATAGKVFEQSRYNDKTRRQPPQKFASTSSGLVAGGDVKNGASLPYLSLKRVTILTTPGTCSASESVINSLRGVDIEVNLIGAPTCGKPYAFYPTNNCGTTYFAIQFQGVNNKGFGDYADGFPATCNVADDLSHPLGDVDESLLATALSYRASGQCPASSMRSRVVSGGMQVVRPAVKEISIR